VINDYLKQAAQQVPERPAILDDDGVWSFAELDAQADAMANRLANIANAGDRVGVLLPNGRDYLLLIHAAPRVGITLVLLNTRLTASEIAWQVKTASCVAVITNGELRAKTGEMGIQVYWVGDLPDGRDVARSYTVPEKDDIRAVIFTSGTTGQPKGAQLTYRNFEASAEGSADRLGVVDGDCWLLCLPLYHVGGLTMALRGVMHQLPLVVVPKFDLADVWKAMHQHAVTLVSLVPTQFYRLMKAYPHQPFPSKVRLYFLGGAAASRELLDQAWARNLPVSTTYGLTEATSQVATILPDDLARKPGSVGKPIKGVSVRVVDADGRELPPHEYGEIIVRGDTVMRGYIGQPETGGELHTGDIGYLDADGDLWVVQRRTDLIISGGENVYPAEVEAVLRKHPAVEDVVVIGIPSAEWGQQVTAAVIRKQNTDVTPTVLIAFARESLAGYKVPRVIHFFDSFPQTAAGKIQRGAVRDLMISLTQQA